MTCLFIVQSLKSVFHWQVVNSWLPSRDHEFNGMQHKIRTLHSWTIAIICAIYHPSIFNIVFLSYLFYVCWDCEIFCAARHPVICCTAVDLLTDLVLCCSIYSQFESCPEADTETADPDYLTVPLMTHQRQALTWLIWREQQKPSGGILGMIQHSWLYHKHSACNVLA